MAFDDHKNFAYSTVATAPSPATSGTSLVVAAGDGTKFPVASFNAVVWPANAQPLSSNAEIVRVTVIATDTFTITRTQEGTSARTIVVGDQIAACVTDKTLTDIEAASSPTLSIYNYPAQAANVNANFAPVNSTWHINPMTVEDYVTADIMRVLASVAHTNTTTIATSANATGSCQLLSTQWCLLYTLGIGASSHSLQSVSSFSVGFTGKWSLSANVNGSQWTLSQSITYPLTGGTSQFTTGVTTSLTNYSLGSLSLTAFSGLRWMDFGFSSSLSPGVYFLALGGSSTTSTSGIAAMTQLRGSATYVGVPQFNFAVNPFGQSTNSSNPYMRGLGSFTTNVINSTASLDLSNISTEASHILMCVNWEKGV